MDKTSSIEDIVYFSSLSDEQLYELVTSDLIKRGIITCDKEYTKNDELLNDPLKKEIFFSVHRSYDAAKMTAIRFKNYFNSFNREEPYLLYDKSLLKKLGEENKAAEKS